MEERTDTQRYRKQMLFAGIGESGQRRLGESRVILIGCGALGCVLADAMVRAGVGCVTIVDRDFVELSNLQRQTLFTEADVASQLPKVIAAADRLRAVNSEVEIRPIVADVDYRNIRELTDSADLILDGTDNFEVRYLINDVSLETGIPWIFTGCTGSHGQMLPVFPGSSACLRCLMPTPPPPGSTETCDTAGVLGPAIGVIASWQAAAALRILVSPRRLGQAATAETTGLGSQLILVDVWDGTMRRMDLSSLRDTANCPACFGGERLWLHGTQHSGSTVLCGRNAVQVTPAERLQVALPDLASRLNAVGRVTCNAFLLRVHITEPAVEISVFADGRAIIRGTEDPLVARAVYSRFIGS